ncbi:MAG: glycosyltransferase family 4 protein [Chloroflexi bacterium]|nr:glycosyltransferase family 4 protein [Chloroflexota bacterium]
MKVVFIGPFGLQPKATMSVRALSLGQALAARGHEITMLIPPWDDPGRAGQVWEDGGVKVINVKLPPRLPLLFHILLTRTLVAEALVVKPEVIHFFKPKAYSGLAHLGLWWLRRLTGLPVRLVVDADDWEQAWNELGPYSAAQKRLFVWQEKWGLRHADAITAASRALEKLVTTQVEGDSARVFYLPNGCCPQGMSGDRRPETGSISSPSPVSRLPSPDAATVRERWRLGDAPTILLYSRFWEFRLGRIVTLVREVAAQLPQARWLMVGQGLQGEDKVLAVLLAEAGLAEYVRFAGWLPLGEAPAYFAAANVAVYPYDDTPINRTKCSVKLISLLQAGLPVVADAVGQNVEYIQQGLSGILTPAEDDAAMAAALVALLQDPAQQRKLGQAARQYLAENFDWAYLAQKAERAYC